MAKRRAGSREFISILDGKQIALPDVSWYSIKVLPSCHAGYWVLGIGYLKLETGF